MKFSNHENKGTLEAADAANADAYASVDELGPDEIPFPDDADYN